MSVAKFVLNNVWSNFCKQDKVPISAKWAIYNAVCRVIVGDRAQVWGFKVINDFEVFQRFAIKKLVCVEPGSTTVFP